MEKEDAHVSVGFDTPFDLCSINSDGYGFLSPRKKTGYVTMGFNTPFDLYFLIYSNGYSLLVCGDSVNDSLNFIVFSINQRIHFVASIVKTVL